MKSKIAIIGTVGLPACYGGFESLVENLVKYKKNDIEYTVFCSSKFYKNKKNEYMGAKLLYVPFNANGISSIIYDIICLIKCLTKKYDVILVLGVSGCIFLPLFKLISKSKIITNIDGLEWKREKWGGFAKWFLKLSEKIAVRNSDIIIADNEAISKYVMDEYNIRTEVIAYGGDHALIQMEDYTSEKGTEYYLSLCRIEPENNVHVILEAFSKSQQNLKFIGNWNISEYGIQLKEKYSKCHNIELLDPIYDLQVLYNYRNQCVGYVHGHSAGGTNPSLVEAMHFSKTVIAYDCEFNRFTTQNRAVYFSDVASLITIIESNFDNGRIMKEIAEKKYTWEKISSEYSKLFN
ncbi:hypothetical protein L435_06450 [Enterobacter hormaechei]|nr:MULTISPECIES: DUF1972 domain-containing protein [Enterobacter]EUM31236.1 hypothetical protein L435_06450 [Enterobacter hormaechei]